MYPPRKSPLSSQCATIILPSLFASSIAARIISSDCTPLPSSENAIAFPAIAAISLSLSPFSPSVIEPYGTTSIEASRLIISSCFSRFSAESGTGFKLGIVQTDVYPPLAAARLPLRMVSL